MTTIAHFSSSSPPPLACNRYTPIAAVIMSALRILVPVKRVIDYAVKPSPPFSPKHCQSSF